MHSGATEDLPKNSSEPAMHEAQKPICVFPDGSYAFRTQKQIVYVDTYGRVSKTTLNGPMDLMDKDKAQAFALSEANMAPSPSFRGNGPSETPDDGAVREVHVDRAHADTIIGAVARKKRSPNKPIVAYVNESLGNPEGAAQTVADHFDLPVQIKMDECTLAKSLPELYQSND